jgi:two-component system nitrate/nitrite response regulator NarL
VKFQLGKNIMALAAPTLRPVSKPKGLVTSFVIADRHPIVLYGLAALLKQQSDFRVSAMCQEGDAALKAILKYSPRVALLDLNLPKMPGLEVLAIVSKQLPTTRVVMFTSSTELRGALAAVHRGAAGIIMKETMGDNLIRCLRRVSSGQSCLPRTLMLQERSRLSQVAATRAILTAREREVVRMVAEGLSNKGIAARLGISEGTTKLHLHHVYSKIGTSKRSYLAKLALSLADAPGEMRAHLIQEAAGADGHEPCHHCLLKGYSNDRQFQRHADG